MKKLKPVYLYVFVYICMHTDIRNLFGFVYAGKKPLFLLINVI